MCVYVSILCQLYIMNLLHCNLYPFVLPFLVQELISLSDFCPFLVVNSMSLCNCCHFFVMNLIPCDQLSFSCLSTCLTVRFYHPILLRNFFHCATFFSCASTYFTVCLYYPFFFILFYLLYSLLSFLVVKLNLSVYLYVLYRISL